MSQFILDIANKNVGKSLNIHIDMCMDTAGSYRCRYFKSHIIKDTRFYHDKLFHQEYSDLKIDNTLYPILNSESDKFLITVKKDSPLFNLINNNKIPEYVKCVYGMPEDSRTIFRNMSKIGGLFSKITNCSKVINQQVFEQTIRNIYNYSGPFKKNSNKDIHYYLVIIDNKNFTIQKTYGVRDLIQLENHSEIYDKIKINKKKRYTLFELVSLLSKSKILQEIPELKKIINNAVQFLNKGGIFHVNEQYLCGLIGFHRLLDDKCITKNEINEIFSFDIDSFIYDYNERKKMIERLTGYTLHDKKPCMKDFLDIIMCKLAKP
jgi:hypothetical protein